MSEKNNGGPAFPAYFKEGAAFGEDFAQPGMTLRDWFAGQALAGMHARDTFDPGQAEPHQRASLAYIDADAMLKARGEA